jgi:hypothetical protein
MAADKLRGTSSQLSKTVIAPYMIKITTDRICAYLIAKTGIRRNETPLRLA